LKDREKFFWKYTNTRTAFISLGLFHFLEPQKKKKKTRGGGMMRKKKKKKGEEK